MGVAVSQLFATISATRADQFRSQKLNSLSTRVRLDAAIHLKEKALTRSITYIACVSFLGSTAILSGPTMVRAESQQVSSCAEPAFDGFLQHFGREIAFQEKSVADPLVSAFVDVTAEPEPQIVSKKIPLKDVEWPVIADLKMLKKSGHEVTISDEPSGIKKVLVRKPDTGDQQSYYFARQPCWQLIRMFDESL